MSLTILGHGRYTCIILAVGHTGQYRDIALAMGQYDNTIKLSCWQLNIKFWYLMHAPMHDVDQISIDSYMIIIIPFDLGSEGPGGSW